MPLASYATIAEVERIGDLTDPVLRNLQITQCYHELSLVLTKRTGLVSNWCTFATWASKQAGQTIRKDDLAEALDDFLQTEAAAIKAAQDLQLKAQRWGRSVKVEEIPALIWKAYDIEAVFNHSSAAVAGGNLKVFQEIAMEFARFEADCGSDEAFDAEKIDRFCEQLQPGDPPNGQRLLRQAFQHYYSALFTEDDKARIELLLLANLEIGLHEQIRLQPDINEALSAPIVSPQQFAHNLLKALSPDAAWFTELLWLILRWLGRLAEFDNAIKGYVEGAQRQAQYLVTKTMMSIELSAKHRLMLGEDLSAAFPPPLKQLSSVELAELLAQIDPTPDSTRESGAEHWGDLADRIHFIADMFRCYAISPELHEPPFTPAQTADLKDGRLPGGDL